MKNKLQQIAVYIVGATLVIGGVIFAGSLVPTTNTDTTNFITISDLYNKIVDNNYSVGSHSISTSSSPVSSMYTLSDIYNVIPVLSSNTIISGTNIMGVNGTYEVSNLSPENVREGVTYGPNGSLVGTMIAPPPGWTCGNSITDADNNSYSTVLIGTQCWMAENMMTTKYADGSSIVRGTPTPNWTGDNSYYAYPPNLTNNGEETIENIISNKLGFVYQWSAAMHGSTLEGAQGICPDGWHVPSNNDYKILVEGLATPGCDSSTGFLCSPAGSHLSLYTLNGDNSSGFSATLPGYRAANGGFNFRSTQTRIWTSTASSTNPTLGVIRGLNSTVDTVLQGGGSNKALGFTVRCLKD